MLDVIGKGGSEVRMLGALEDFEATLHGKRNLSFTKFFTLVFLLFCRSYFSVFVLLGRRSKTGPILNGTSPLYFSLVNFILKFLDLRDRALPLWPGVFPAGP